MSVQTHVSIYGVDDTGATSALLGSGTLIDPVFVLLHPPLGQRLAGSGNSIRLRAGIASTGTDAGLVEVIDGDKLHVSPNQGPEPLVALELRQPAAAPVAPLSPVGDDAEAATELLVQYLASLPDSGPDGGHPGLGPASTDDFPWCPVWPDGPGCRN